LPSIHRYLGGLAKSRLGRTLAVGAAVPALLLAVAACGGAASAAPAAGSSPNPGSSSGSSGSGGASAYFNCLREHGVTGFGGGSSSGSTSSGSTSSGGSSSGGSSSGSAPSSSTINNARKACASLRPSGGFGGSSGFSAAFSKFESCLSAHGVTLPSPSASGGGFRGLFSELQSNPADQAAFNACKSDLPFTPGGGGGYGGSGGYGGGYGGSGGSTSGGGSGTSGGGGTGSGSGTSSGSGSGTSSGTTTTTGGTSTGGGTTTT
jgi:hypothetical protein